MNEKGEFSKTKATMCNVPIELVDVCHIFPRPLIVIYIKRGLRYKGYVCFEPVHLCVIN